MPRECYIRRLVLTDPLARRIANRPLLYFTQAATELSVTSGAVAAQIKSMEREFGAALFERNAKGVRLTKLGESVSENFTQAFDALEEAARDLRQRAAPNKVHIVTSPALAQLWLHPRLLRMAEIAGPVDISVTVLDDPPNLKRSPFDICLFYLDKVEAYQTPLYEEHALVNSRDSFANRPISCGPSAFRTLSGGIGAFGHRESFQMRALSRTVHHSRFIRLPYAKRCLAQVF